MEPPSIVRDFASLFSSWKKSQAHSFLGFKEFWKLNEFSMIHAATVEGFCTNEEWMNVLYSCTYAYLLVDDPRIQLASLYCLYTLYSTQPYKVKHPVIITTYLWKVLEELLTTHKIPGISDGVAIYNTLIKQEAWTFSANIDILPPPHLWASQSSKFHFQKSRPINNRSNIDHVLSQISKVDQEYEEAVSVVHLGRKAETQKPFLSGSRFANNDMNNIDLLNNNINNLNTQNNNNTKIQ